MQWKRFQAPALMYTNIIEHFVDIHRYTCVKQNKLREIKSVCKVCVILQNIPGERERSINVERLLKCHSPLIEFLLFHVIYPVLFIAKKKQTSSLNYN